MPSAIFIPMPESLGYKDVKVINFFKYISCGEVARAPNKKPTGVFLTCRLTLKKYSLFPRTLIPGSTPVALMELPI
jgi:hypothetical protein